MIDVRIVLDVRIVVLLWVKKTHSFTMSEKEGKSKGALGGLWCCQCPIY